MTLFHGNATSFQEIGSHKNYDGSHKKEIVALFHNAVINIHNLGRNKGCNVRYKHFLEALLS